MNANATGNVTLRRPRWILTVAAAVALVLTTAGCGSKNGQDLDTWITSTGAIESMRTAAERHAGNDRGFAITVNRVDEIRATIAGADPNAFPLVVLGRHLAENPQAMLDAPTRQADFAVDFLSYVAPDAGFREPEIAAEALNRPGLFALVGTLSEADRRSLAAAPEIAPFVEQSGDVPRLTYASVAMPLANGQPATETQVERFWGAVAAAVVRQRVQASAFDDYSRRVLLGIRQYPTLYR